MNPMRFIHRSLTLTAIGFGQLSAQILAVIHSYRDTLARERRGQRTLRAKSSSSCARTCGSAGIEVELRLGFNPRPRAGLYPHHTRAPRDG
jgi:hypothetical protein